MFWGSNQQSKTSRFNLRSNRTQIAFINKKDVFANRRNYGKARWRKQNNETVIRMRRIDLALTEDEYNNVQSLALYGERKSKMYDYVGVRRDKMRRCQLSGCGYEPLNLASMETTIRDHPRRRHKHGRTNYISHYQNDKQ